MIYDNHIYDWNDQYQICSFFSKTEGFWPMVISVLQLEFTIIDNVIGWSVAQWLGLSGTIPCLGLKFIYLNHSPLACLPEALQCVLVFWSHCWCSMLKDAKQEGVLAHPIAVAEHLSAVLPRPCKSVSCSWCVPGHLGMWACSTWALPLLGAWFHECRDTYGRWPLNSRGIENTLQL